MTEALKASFASWEKEQERLSIPKDPRLWSESDVSRWLNWAIKEFSLEGVVLQHFRMRGRDMCAMGKENFLARTPPFMGDILWEHLEILQKDVERAALGSVPANFYESICVPVPDLRDFLAGSSANNNTGSSNNNNNNNSNRGGFSPPPPPAVSSSSGGVSNSPSNASTPAGSSSTTAQPPAGSAGAQVTGSSPLSVIGSSIQPVSPPTPPTPPALKMMSPISQQQQQQQLNNVLSSMNPSRLAVSSTSNGVTSYLEGSIGHQNAVEMDRGALNCVSLFSIELDSLYNTMGVLFLSYTVLCLVVYHLLLPFFFYFLVHCPAPNSNLRCLLLSFEFPSSGTERRAWPSSLGCRAPHFPSSYLNRVILFFMNAKGFRFFFLSFFRLLWGGWGRRSCWCACVNSE
ncbi:ETS-like protein pointed isoform X4 [Daphnia magna]|nr:ETS-like protein pointed isoform X4 [Daphnia magna]XP_045026231.1 ETS-like protein pointed isoform X4 [Daphnia magna]